MIPFLAPDSRNLHGPRVNAFLILSFVLLFGLPIAAASESGVLPYFDADNEVEAATMLLLEEHTKPVIASACAEHYPKYRDWLMGALAVRQARVDRLMRISSAILGPGLPTEAQKATSKAAADLVKALPEENHSIYCDNFFAEFADPEAELKRKTPRVLQYLNAYEEKHPFPYRIKQGFVFRPTCLVSSLNAKKPASDAVRDCACTWEGIARSFDEQEWQAVLARSTAQEALDEKQLGKLHKIRETCTPVAQ